MLNPSPQPAGGALGSFSVAIVIGSGTVMACYAFALAAAQLDILSQLDQGSWLQKEVATRLMKCLVLHGISDPKDDPTEQMLEALSEKRAAASRTHPSPHQHWFVYNRLLAKSPANRRSRAYMGSHE